MAGREAVVTALSIRPAEPADADAVWAIVEPVIRAGETLALPRDMGRTDALEHWMGDGRAAFVATEGIEVVGVYSLRPNQPGGGAHVANCGYATTPAATGRGVARTMCAHSLEEARRREYRAMQFNFVIGSNVRAVRLWQAMGFDIVGRLPGAFAHPSLGLVDALVMFRRL